MSNKKTSFFSGDFEKLALKLTLIVALIIPLVCTLFLSPFIGMLQANSAGNEVLYEILVQFSSLLASTAFFAECAVIVCLMLAQKTKLAWKLFWIQAILLLFVAVFLKRGVLWLNALIDEYVLSEIGSFVLSNYTLAHIEGEHPIAETSMIPAFLDVLALIFAMTAGVVAVKIKICNMRKRGRKISEETLISGFPQNKLVNRYASVSVITLLAVQMISQIIYTVGAVSESGAPELIADHIFLILPFVYKIAFAIVGYFVCQYVTYAMISRFDKK